MSDVRKPLAHMLSEETDRTVPVVVVEDDEEENDSWADLNVDTQVVPRRARDQQVKETRRANEVWKTKMQYGQLTCTER